MSTQSIVFCEGYHDRAFWKGLLLRLGCTDPGLPPAGALTRPRVLDPWRQPVTGGRFAFVSPTSHFIQVYPCGGKTNIMPLVRQQLLRKQATEPVRRIIINEDADLPAAATATAATPAAVEAAVKAADPAAVQDASGEWQLNLHGATVGVSLVLWTTPDPPARGVPAFQTLERLVAASICAAHGGRGDAVQDWLGSRPSPPVTDVKEFAWSYMAGWHAPMGCEAFYSTLWNDPAVAAEIESRLQATGAWNLIQTFAQ